MRPPSRTSTRCRAASTATADELRVYYFCQIAVKNCHGDAATSCRSAAPQNHAGSPPGPLPDPDALGHTGGPVPPTRDHPGKSNHVSTLRDTNISTADETAQADALREALIAELVGVTGEVTTVDIDPDVVDRARDCLAAARYDKVNVVVADAEGGVPDHAPYDRVIVTVGAWDIPPSWSDQLAEGGRIVVPLRMRGLTRSVAFERDGDHLVSRAYHLCGFVPMQGVGAHTERLVSLDGDEVRLQVDEALPVDADRLREALSAPRVKRWSGVEIGGAPTMVAGGSFAYRTARRIDSDRSRFEFGVYAHDPDAEGLADQYAGLIRTWDRDHRHGTGARIKVYPAATPDTDLPKGRLIDKRHTRVVIP